MKTWLSQSICLGLLPLAISACGNDPPAFTEKQQGIITLFVEDTPSASTASPQDQFTMDELTDETASSSSADATSESDPSTSDSVSTAANTTDTRDTSSSTAAPASKAAGKSTANAQGKSQGKSTAARSSSDELSATDSVEAPGAPHTLPTSSSGSAPVTTTASAPAAAVSEAKAVAKACAPHFANLSQKIRVIDSATAQSNLTISADTVIAFKVTGNQSKLLVNLPAGSTLPGVCFFVSGHEAEVQFNTASAVQGFAYIAAGDQSSGKASFQAASPDVSHIELKGNQASLTTQGLSDGLCQEAKTQGHAAGLQCQSL